jgi:hypothetical protein
MLQRLWRQCAAWVCPPPDRDVARSPAELHRARISNALLPVMLFVFGANLLLLPEVSHQQVGWQRDYIMAMALCAIG